MEKRLFKLIEENKKKAEILEIDNQVLEPLIRKHRGTQRGLDLSQQRSINSDQRQIYIQAIADIESILELEGFLIKTETKTISEDRKCPKCEIGYLKHTETLLSDPPHYEYKCTACNHEKSFRTKN